ncbi:MAG TPA: response regulator transcription factor [Saprospiraceae bacterium]|nr:response regulator transcription factor [Saprospiraceae bacterium]
MSKYFFLIIESSEIFTQGTKCILSNGFGEDAEIRLIHKKSDLIIPPDVKCIIVGNGLGVEMNFFEILEYIQSLRIKAPKLCIPEMITSKMAKTLYTSRMVDGLMHRDCTAEELIHGVNEILRGEVFIGRNIWLHQTKEQSIKATKKDDPFYLVQTLTDQEKLIMEYVIEGKSSNDISQILFRSVHTIKTHRRNLLNKLGVTNTIELITYLDSIGYKK